MKNKITKGSMIVILYDCGTVMSVAVRKRGIIARNLLCVIIIVT